MRWIWICQRWKWVLVIVSMPFSILHNPCPSTHTKKTPLQYCFTRIAVMSLTWSLNLKHRNNCPNILFETKVNWIQWHRHYIRFTLNSISAICYEPHYIKKSFHSAIYIFFNYLVRNVSWSSPPSITVYYFLGRISHYHQSCPVSGSFKIYMYDQDKDVNPGRVTWIKIDFNAFYFSS